MHIRGWPLVRVVFGLAGLCFLILALAETVRRSEGDLLPSGLNLFVAGILALAALLIGARAWSCLFDRENGRVLRRGFYTSQLGKYIPGAVWQMLALIDSASRSGAGIVRSSVRFPVYLLTTLAAGGTIGAGVALAGSSAPTAARFGSLAGLLTLPLLSRRGMVFVIGMIRRLSRKDLFEDVVPSQKAIIESYFFGLGTVLAGSAAFAVLLASLHTGVSGLEAATTFALAWTAGFVAVPFPSGIGIREAVLIGMIGRGLGGPVVSAAVGHRILTIAAELVLLLSLAKRARIHR